MELLKYIYFCAQKSITKAGNSKFQDLVNAPRNCHTKVFDAFKHSTFSRTVPSRVYEASIFMHFC